MAITSPVGVSPTPLSGSSLSSESLGSSAGARLLPGGDVVALAPLGLLAGAGVLFAYHVAARSAAQSTTTTDAGQCPRVTSALRSAPVAVRVEKPHVEPVTRPKASDRSAGTAADVPITPREGAVNVRKPEIAAKPDAPVRTRRVRFDLGEPVERSAPGPESQRPPRTSGQVGDSVGQTGFRPRGILKISRHSGF